MEYKWIAQDEDGWICKFKKKPRYEDGCYYIEGGFESLNEEHGMKCVPILINLQTHDYKIEDGILVSITKTTRCKYADVFIEAAEDSSKVLQYSHDGVEWSDYSPKEDVFKYRIKPANRTVRFYNYIDHEGNIKVSVDTPPPSALWVSEVQNVEI